MVTSYTNGGTLSDASHALLWLRAVPNDIAKHPQPIETVTCPIMKHRFKSAQVGVDIRND